MTHPGKDGDRPRLAVDVMGLGDHHTNESAKLRVQEGPEECMHICPKESFCHRALLGIYQQCG